MPICLSYRFPLVQSGLWLRPFFHLREFFIKIARYILEKGSQLFQNKKAYPFPHQKFDSFIRSQNRHSLVFKEHELHSTIKHNKNDEGFKLSGTDFKKRARVLGKGFEKYVMIENLVLFDQLKRDYKRFPVILNLSKKNILLCGQYNRLLDFEEDIQLTSTTLASDMPYNAHQKKVIETCLNLINQVTLFEAVSLLSDSLKSVNNMLSQNKCYFKINPKPSGSIELEAYIDFFIKNTRSLECSLNDQWSITMTCEICLEKGDALIKNVNYLFNKQSF
jgi:hypothetical protein